MTALTVEQALENIYASLVADNAEIDIHNKAAKDALAAAGKKELVVDPKRLAQNNRQGRKVMEAYFRKRGISVVFTEA